MRFEMMRICKAALVFAVCGLLLVGCGGESGGEGEVGGSAALPEGLFLDSAPEGVKLVSELKASAAEGDEVVVRVVVGGRMEPMVASRASAMIVDAALDNPCTGEDDHCKTPWDYCCTAPEEITANLATLQVLNEQGKPFAASLSPKIEPLSTLVVRGVVGPRPDAQVLTINATGIFIESAAP